MVKAIVIRPQTEQFEMPAACRDRSGIGRDQNERQNDWERTHVGR